MNRFNGGPDSLYKLRREIVKYCNIQSGGTREKEMIEYCSLWSCYVENGHILEEGGATRQIHFA